MASSLNIPAVGPVDKRVVIGVGSAALAYVAYQFVKSRKAAAAATDTTTDPGFGDAGTIPAVSGAVSPDNSYGSGSTPPATTDYGFTGTSNSEWTQYATTQLEQSETWSYTDIVSALGNFIASKPLTTLQQQIVQAAIAVAGYPPVGTHTIIPGGDTPVLVAPTGVHATATGTTTVRVSWTPVPGINGYYIYRNGASTEIGAGLGDHATVSGLQPNTQYTFYVAAHSPAGKIGPRSSGVAAKTLAPSGPSASSETAIRRTP